MQAGKIHRWNRIFRSNGNAIVVAMDHAGGGGPLPGLERPGETIARLVDAGVDAIMTSYGTARAFQAELRGRGLILRIDSGDHLRYRVEDALRIGADSVITMGWVYEDFTKNHNLKYVAEVASDCERWGVPFLAEMLPFEHIPFFYDANNPPKSQLPEAVARACRTGAELGADYIKTMYTGDLTSFHKAVEGAYVPLLILGGDFVPGKTKQVLTTVWESIRAGGHGIVMGRNIWAHPRPDQVVRALTAIIHSDATVDEALTAFE
jgi:DhnA family fructose-bisphosphate aldolase class Ia